MDSLINRRIYDSDDENWKENRKKSLHDPMNVRKDSNKYFGKTSKLKVDKIHQKREKKKAATIVVRPTLLRVCLFYTYFKIVEISKNFRRNPICIMNF